LSKKGRSRYRTDWREPTLQVIYVVNEQGRIDLEFRKLAVIQPHMAVYVQGSRQFRNGFHPITEQQAGPALRPIPDRRRGQFAPQATHLRHAVQAEQLPQFARRLILQLFDRLDSAECHVAQRELEGHTGGG
jgi:hypothetical protein